MCIRDSFCDLQDEDYDSAIAIVHSRFSTNTNPSWERAHPNRFIVHNGEINTIRGNADKMLAREETMRAPAFSADDITKVLPVVNTSGSDSAMLDNTLEFLVMSGMELPLAVMIAIPEPWNHNDTISQELRDFYQYYATMMEPWDGPASILFLSLIHIWGGILRRDRRGTCLRRADLCGSARARNSAGDGEHRTRQASAGLARGCCCRGRKVVWLSAEAPVSCAEPVSYTHLDVYKRQLVRRAN